MINKMHLYELPAVYSLSRAATFLKNSLQLSMNIFENPADTRFVLVYVPFFIIEKKRYRESYISDDLDLDPPGSESSPGLSRHSTSSSGIEADTRQHSISTEMTSMEEDCQRRGERCFTSAASHGSSCTSGFDRSSKAPKEEGETFLLFGHFTHPNACFLELVLYFFF